MRRFIKSHYPILLIPPRMLCHQRGDRKIVRVRGQEEVMGNILSSFGYLHKSDLAKVLP